MNTATNPDADWLFPGGRSSPAPSASTTRLGVQVTQTRAAALGYHHGTATPLSADAPTPHHVIQQSGQTLGDRVQRLARRVPSRTSNRPAMRSGELR
ncbi:Uncharacterised protein [Actinomadura madurae]|nr:Uncharacterised protein [Actinomadura madurae]